MTSARSTFMVQVDPSKIRTRDLPKYQDAVERLTKQVREATAKRDAAISLMSRDHTHDAIVAKLGDHWVCRTDKEHFFALGQFYADKSDPKYADTACPECGGILERKPRLTRGRIGQVAPPKRVPKPKPVRVDLDADTDDAVKVA